MVTLRSKPGNALLEVVKLALMHAIAAVGLDMLMPIAFDRMPYNSARSEMASMLLVSARFAETMSCDTKAPYINN